ncbi:TetR family transcriptional regulator [Spirillospora sp. CA-255316]
MAVDSMDERAPGDLTGRARIRDAALRLFAERGIAAATIRDIAKEAGVSSGLVRHHFGSKEALRDACDTYATDRVNQLWEQMFAEGRLGDTAFMASIHPTTMLLQNYLVRSMMDGSPAAAAMFRQMVEIGEQWLADHGTESPDVRAYSAVLCAMQMGVFLMRDQMSDVLGVDVRTEEGHARVNRGFVDVFSHPLLTPEQAAQIHAASDRVQAEAAERGRADTAAGPHPGTPTRERRADGRAPEGENGDDPGDSR